MTTVHFTRHLQQYAPSESVTVEASSVATALDQALAGNDQLRSYLLDDQGRLRRHVTVFVDGQMLSDRLGLSDPVRPNTEIYVMQALSGG